MIKLVGVQPIATAVTSTITPEVRTYDIVSEMMSDECKPYRVAEHAMLWLDNQGFLGELECIYPQVVEQPLCNYLDEVIPQNGYPQLIVSSCDNVSYIQHQGDNFSIWLAKDKTIDNEVLSGNVHFLFADNELVGLVSTPSETVSNGSQLALPT